MFDWQHELSTTDPQYYKWTQWIFLQLSRRGLAYKKKAAVNWCPSDKTVLANEQVIDGACERCGTRGRAAHAGAVVLPDHRVRRPAAGQPGRQSKIDWSDSTKTAQRNWIGRSRGRGDRFRRSADGGDEPVTRSAVFTTRPDTVFGATFMVLAPEHPLVERSPRRPSESDVEAYRKRGRVEGPGLPQDRRQGEDRRLHRRLRDQPGDRRADPGLDRRLRADGVRHRRDHGRARARRARLRVRARSSACRSCAWSPAHPERATRRHAARRRPTPTTKPAASSTPAQFDGMPVARREGGDHRAGSERDGAGKRRGATTACTTGASRASATGARRSRSSTATSCGAVPVPEKDLPVRAARDRRLPARRHRRVAARARTRSGTTRRARPAASGAGARPTSATPSSTAAWYFLRYPEHRVRRPAVRPGAHARPGCRCTPTSAATSTRCCTCCTRASSRWCCTTWGTLTFEEPFTRFRAHGLIVKDGAKMSKSQRQRRRPRRVHRAAGAPTPSACT